MRLNQILTVITVLAALLNPLALPAQAQKQGNPIDITFGQPNIWSLEQAHYLLSQMRERSLGIKAKNLTNLDPNDTNATRLNIIRQLFGLSTEFRQSPGSTNPTSSPSPVPFPSPVTEPNPLTGTVLSELLKDKDFVGKLFGDAKLNATTQLDNHIQLQYEIIAKQLTLLRDEVGPDERLVFLELPQSIYSTPDKADNKVAQVYWQADGYGEVKEERYVKANIYKILKKLEESDSKIKTRENLEENIKHLKGKIQGLENEKESKAKQVDDLKKYIEGKCKGLEPDDCKNKKKSLEDGQEKLNQTQENYDKTKEDYERKQHIFEDLKELQETLDRRKLQEVEEEIERLKQGGARPNEDIIKETRAAIITTPTPEIKTSPTPEIKTSGNTDVTWFNSDAASTVRTVDIIPRQSSLNVNDIQETVKSTVISAAFSFLFGFGAKTNFQRQRDTYEQYVHQELYASGFGKGSSVFGWTFGAVPGTKRIAPGVRTTYAVMIVPRKAESLILSARGCYFPRKNFQPTNIMQLSESDKHWWKDNKRECFASRQFIIPIPNGGDARGFWLTEIDFSPVKKGSQRLVSSINGRNFSQQVGVLVDGVPLQQVVELTRKLPDERLLDDYCHNGICGAYEVIDSNEITLVFQMPDDYKGTPEITVIGPGRSVSVNRIRLSRIQVGSKKFFNSRLNDENVPLMFGAKDKQVLAINELQILREVTTPISTITALLTGTKFEKDVDEIIVNDVRSPNLIKDFLSPENYKLTFPSLNTDSFTVMVRRCRDKNGRPKLADGCDISEAVQDSFEVALKIFPVAQAQFAVTNAVALSYNKDDNIMFVRIEGVGLSKAKLSKVNGNTPPTGSGEIPVSSREILVKVIQPEAVVKITLTNPNGKEISTVVARPLDETLQSEQNP